MAKDGRGRWPWSSSRDDGQQGGRPEGDRSRPGAADGTQPQDGAPGGALGSSLPGSPVPDWSSPYGLGRGADYTDRWNSYTHSSDGRVVNPFANTGDTEPEAGSYGGFSSSGPGPGPQPESQPYGVIPPIPPAPGMPPQAGQVPMPGQVPAPGYPQTGYPSAAGPSYPQVGYPSAGGPNYPQIGYPSAPDPSSTAGFPGATDASYPQVGYPSTTGPAGLNAPPPGVSTRGYPTPYQMPGQPKRKVSAGVRWVWIIAGIILLGQLGRFFTVQTPAPTPMPPPTWSSTYPAPTPTSTPLPPTVTPGSSVTSFAGSGPATIPLPDLGDELWIVDFTYSGSDYMFVTTHDTRGNPVDYIISEDGPTSGTTFLNYWTDGAVGLVVDGDGDWTFEFRPASQAPVWDGVSVLTGTDVQVFQIDPALALPAEYDFTYVGTSNIIVSAVVVSASYETNDLLINEIDDWSERVTLAVDSKFLFIESASGTWTFTPR